MTPEAATPAGNTRSRFFRPRKRRKCSITLDHARHPVVVEGDDGAVVLLPLVAVGWLEEVAG